MPPFSDLIAAHVEPQSGELRERFALATPFSHCVIEGFFDPAFAQSLLQDFPGFDQGNHLNEDGVAGGKSTVEQIHDLGAPYQRLDDLIQGKEFLGSIERITGIPNLLYDPHYFGGGTHENRDGQSLDSHIDFNYHPATGWHRRLNLIVYLNPEWQDDWGGALELHRDPYDQATDEVVTISPTFNRCVIFETTEHSWHGFAPIRLPETAAGLSRRSIALYFYTRERPEAQTASRHSTIYVDRPLPGHIVAGRTLTERDVAEIQELLARRDGHNRRLYDEVRSLYASLDRSFASRLFSAARRFIARRRPG